MPGGPRVCLDRRKCWRLFPMPAWGNHEHVGKQKERLAYLHLVLRARDPGFWTRWRREGPKPSTFYGFPSCFCVLAGAATSHTWELITPRKEGVQEASTWDKLAAPMGWDENKVWRSGAGSGAENLSWRAQTRLESPRLACWNLHGMDQCKALEPPPKCLTRRHLLENFFAMSLQCHSYPNVKSKNAWNRT
jgi:hypothetical protein